MASLVVGQNEEWILMPQSVVRPNNWIDMIKVLRDDELHSRPILKGQKKMHDKDEEEEEEDEVCKERKRKEVNPHQRKVKERKSLET